MKPAAFSKGRFKIKIKHVLLKCIMFECFGEGDQFWQPRGFNPKTHRRIMSATLKPTEISLEKHRGAAFGGCFSQSHTRTLSSRTVVSKDGAVYLLEVRIYFLEGRCNSREDYFGH